MNTHEIYVTLETSKLLKEAGVDWIEYNLYNLDDNRLCCVGVCPANWNDIEGRLSAPTLAVAQRWLREVKRVFPDIYSHYSMSKDTMDFSVFILSCRQEDPYNHFWRGNDNQFIIFDTYEEALEAGIQKCLTIILEGK